MSITKFRDHSSRRRHFWTAPWPLRLHQGKRMRVSLGHISFHSPKKRQRLFRVGPASVVMVAGVVLLVVRK